MSGYSKLYSIILMMLIGCDLTWKSESAQEGEQAGVEDDDECTEGYLFYKVDGSGEENDILATHCVDIQGPDEGMNHYFYSTSSSSDCYADDPSPVLWTQEDSWWFLSSNGHPNICNSDDMTGAFKFSFEPTSTYNCSDYAFGKYNYIMLEAGYSMPYLHVWGGLNCMAEATALSAEAVADLLPKKAVRWSSDETCVDGSATFDLVPRVLRGTDAVGNSAVQLMAVAKNDADFPERAWLRKIQVTDWGDATTIRFADYNQMLDFDGSGGVSGGTAVTANAPLNLSVGDAMMSTMFGMSGYELGDEWPEVKLDWSCARDPQDPHYVGVPSHTAYVGDFSSLGLSHDIVFWVDWDHHMLRIAPKGRFLDHVATPIDEDGYFKAPIYTFASTLKGQINVNNNGDLVLENGEVIMPQGVTDIPLSTMTLGAM